MLASAAGMLEWQRAVASTLQLVVNPTGIMLAAIMVLWLRHPRGEVPVTTRPVGPG